MDLSVSIGAGGKQDVVLRNPVMTASGTFSNGIEFAKRFDLEELGGIVSKGTTLRARRGNPQQRTVETAAGMINSIGFQNIGVGALIRQVAPIWARWDVPVFVNIMGDTVSEFGQLARRLDGVPGVSALEVNISCPNVEVGGMEFGQDPDVAASVVTEVRSQTSLPFTVKMTPNVTDIRPVARAVEDAGADAITIMNTVPAMAIDIEQRRPVIGATFGGLSGPAIKPIALRHVYLVSAVVDVPVIASGGISNGRDALEFIMAGASAVQVGTATFRDPRAPWIVREEIEAFCEREGVSKIGEIVGAARRRD
ncbi:MAG: dihydroorotate dehydrogenase [Dehalococcoidia bacterium]